MFGLKSSRSDTAAILLVLEAIGLEGGSEGDEGVGDKCLGNEGVGDVHVVTV